MFKISFKRSVAILLALVLFFTSLPLTAFAETTTTSTETEDEYIYYSDLFYGYSYYLKFNNHLSDIQSNTHGVTTSIINEYITTDHFAWSVISHGIDIATDPTSIAKHISDNIGLSNFRFNDELDKANQKFVAAICDVNLNASKEIGKENKYIKNINSFLKMAKDLESLAAENEAYYKGLDKPELYKTFVDQSIVYLEDYCTELAPKLPSLSSQIYTTLCETTSVLGTLSDALEFAQALALSVTMQETQMELIIEIIDTQSSSSTLYKGMTRLKQQLDNGFVSYFAGTYIADKVYDEIIDFMPNKASDWILGNWATFGSTVTAVVKILNKAVFEWILGVDYSEYTSAIMLVEYADDLYDSLVAKADVFGKPFDSKEVGKYEALFNAYIAMKVASFEECKNLAEHNSNCNSTYAENAKHYFDDENAYGEYVDGVKAFIKAIAPEERMVTDFGEWRIETNMTLRGPSDTIQEDSVYCTKDGFNGEIYPRPNITLTIPKDEFFKVKNISLTPSIGMNYTPAQLVNYGVLNVSNNFSFGGNVYNYGELNIVGNLSGGGASGGRTRFYMSNPNAILRVGGDVFFYHEHDVGAFGVVKSINFIASKITNGTVIFNGRAKQTVKGLSADRVIIDNTSSAGVEFATTTAIKTLFDHKGNNFNLTNQRLDSIFADYDGDGLKDNIDPNPTIHEYCPNGHSYSDWKIIRKATPSIRGIKYKECSGCGDRITETIPMVEKLAFKGASLTLHHNLAINYKADKALFDTVGYTNPYVIFEIGGKKTTVKAYAVEGDRYVFRFRNIAPNQMNDTIYATLYATYNGVEYVSETKEYSVAEYCYSTLDKYAADDYAELRTLLVDLLNYGVQSQLYTNYNTNNLANANLTEAQLAWGTAEEPTLTNSLNTAYETVENPLITWKGASLNLNDSVSMRFKFIAEDIEGLSLKITGETGEWNITANNFVLEDGVYSVRFSGLNAGQMSEKVYLTMYKDGVAVSNTVRYSIESYAYSKQDSTIEHLSGLVKAMMKYGNSAYAFVN